MADQLNQAGGTLEGLNVHFLFPSKRALSVFGFTAPTEGNTNAAVNVLPGAPCPL